MAKLNSKFKYMFDAAPSITLRNGAAAALTADGVTDALVLDELDGYWNTEGELADETLAIVVHVTAIDRSTGDETYSIVPQFGPVGFASNVVYGGLNGITKPGQYVILVDVDTVKAIKDDVAALRLSVDVGGTTPSITFKAWISGIQKA